MMVNAFQPQLIVELLWRATWQAAVLALLVCLVVLLARKHIAPRWRVVLYALPLVRLVLVVAPESSLSLFSLMDVYPAKSLATPIVEPLHSLEAAPEGASDTNGRFANSELSELVSADMSFPEAPSSSIVESDQLDPTVTFAGLSVTNSISGPTILFWLWSLGCVTGVVRLMVGRIRLAGIIAKGKPIDECEFKQPTVRHFSSLGVRRRIRIIVIEGEFGPASTGLFRPTILIPQSLTRELTNEQLAAVVDHETQHICRLDCLYLLLTQISCCVHWFNPLVYWLAARVRSEIEFAVDSATVGQVDEHFKVTYGKLLLQLANRRSHSLGLAPMAGRRSNLERRINELLMPARSSKLHTICCLTAILLLVVTGLSDVASTQETASQSRQTTSVDIGLSPPRIRLTGKVFKPDGSVAAGAIVRAATPILGIFKDVLPEGFRPPVAEAIADSNGAFAIEFNSQPFGDVSRYDPLWQDQWKRTSIVAMLPGYGTNWTSFDELADPNNVSLKLVEDKPVRGTVVDLEGKPIANVNVIIKDLSTGDDEGISGWLEAIANNGSPSSTQALLTRRLDPKLLEISNVLKTDQDGRVELRGLGADRVLQIVIESDRVAHQSANVVIRDMAPMSSHGETVFGATFQLVADPARTIQGVVIDAATKAPLSGVAIKSFHFASRRPSGRGLRTTTDESGRFQLLSMPKGDGNVIEVVPNDEQPYFMRHVSVPNPSGAEPVELIVEMHRGIWITGRITDRISGQPVPAVRVYYIPYLTNKHTENLPEFSRNGKSVDGDEDRYQSNANGEYRLVGLPGPAIVGAKSKLISFRRGVGWDQLTGPKQPSGNFALTFPSPLWAGPGWPDVMREIDPAVGQASYDLNLEMDSGQSVPIRAVDQSGKPVVGAKLFGLLATIGAFSRAVETEDRSYSVTNLGSNETRAIMIHHDSRNLGIVVRISADSQPSTLRDITLLPCAKVSGRLLKDGVPLMGVVVRARIAPVQNWNVSLPTTFTSDSAGRFSGTLLPGCAYELRAESPDFKRVTIVATDLRVEGGMDNDLGTLELVDGQVASKVAADSSR